MQFAKHMTVQYKDQAALPVQPEELIVRLGNTALSIRKGSRGGITVSPLSDGSTRNRDKDDPMGTEYVGYPIV